MKKIALAAAMLPVLSCADASGESRYGSSFDQKAFLPEISLIVDASYVHRNIEDAERESFTLYGIGYSDFAEFNADNGFNLNYAELALSSTVDQAFNLEGVFHFSPEGVEIEEAYFTTRQLPWSLRLKGGKFRSDFGRLNAQHQHIWDFADAPLVYSAFLSSEGLNSTGVQLQWLVPVSWYMMAGIELMQSMEEGSFSNQSFETDTSSVAAGTEPALVIGYWKNSFDIRETTVLIGVSAAKGTSKNEEAAFDGETKLYGRIFSSSPISTATAICRGRANGSIVTVTERRSIPARDCSSDKAVPIASSSMPTTAIGAPDFGTTVSFTMSETESRTIPIETE